MYRVAKTFRFEAAHKLPLHDGQCRKLHGHSYRVEVEVEGSALECDGKSPAHGMLIDFGHIKDAWEGNLVFLDHSLLNDVIKTPTAENLAKMIYDEINIWLPEEIQVNRVRVWETEDCWAEYQQ